MSHIETMTQSSEPKVLSRSLMCLFRSKVSLFCSQVISGLWTPCKRNRHTCERFITKFVYLELGLKQKIQNIIDDQGPKTYL